MHAQNIIRRLHTNYTLKLQASPSDYWRGPRLLETLVDLSTQEADPKRWCMVRQEPTNNEMTMIYREGLRNPGTPGTPLCPNPLLHYTVPCLRIQCVPASRVCYAISLQSSDDAGFHHRQIVIDTICNFIPFDRCGGAVLVGEPVAT
jgi:hypothetical protein